MQYALEILPSLLKGASLTLQVFCFRIDFIDSTWNSSLPFCFNCAQRSCMDS